MKKIIIVLLVLFVCVSLHAVVKGEVVEIKEVAKGIINVKVEYKNDGILIETKTYTVSDSDSAIANFKNVVLPKYFNDLKEEFNSANYDLIPAKIVDSKVEKPAYYEKKKPVEVVPEAKVYPIKVGDKIEEK